MAEVQWIKIYLDMFDKPKIKKVRRLPAGNDLLLIWVMLLVKAGKCNAGGMVYITERFPYTEEDLAEELGFDVNTIRLALKAFVDRRLSKDGERKCDFITIVAWRQTAEFICKYFRKGSAMLVCGEIQTRSWEDNNGNKRYATEVVASEVSFCEVKRDSEGNNASQNQNATESDLGVSQFIPDAYRSQGTPRFEDINTDEGLPF